MTSQPAPKKSPTPTPAKLKPLSFAFPFLRKGRGQSEASAQFTDEHEIYRLLAEREQSGAYLVSRKGMWHGGIHVTEAGAGQSLDLDAGLRCIADGVLIAFRANKTYPVSEIAATGGGLPVQAPYSTGFALVRHTMEFPQGTKLTFYSLYMHLMSKEDYANFPKRDKPSYWSRQWKVTQHAQDKPSAGRNGQVADPSQQGLRVRKSYPRGEIIGILPQGASVSIGKKEKGWGQVMDLHGASLYPPEAGGYVEPSRAVGGWIYLHQKNVGPLVEEVYPDSTFDRVIVTANQTRTKDDPHGDGGIPVKAGDLMGHLGRYDSLDQCTSGTRMAHIEVFCDDSIESFLAQGRAWVNQHGPHKEDWATLGLPFEPTILRIEPGTVLYQRTQDNKFVPGADPQSRKTDAVQVYSLAELARDPKRRMPEPHPNPNPGYPVNWWHVDGVNAQGQPIEGWVCDFNHAGGRVTREFAQKWVDFKCHLDAHDPAHTIFATTQAWVDYASGANAADLASRSKLSPLMLEVYDALFTKGNGKQAADELCTLAQTERGGYPWLMQAASRQIVRHESEWANPSKWKQLIAELEKQTGLKPQHEEEQKRIDKLAWWDEVKAGVPAFPRPEVFHIHPVALVGNFATGCDCAAKFKKISAIILQHEGGYSNRANDKGGPTNHGIAWNTWQSYAMEDLGVEPTIDNLKNLTNDQAEKIYLKRYWEPKGFCKFNDMRVALMVYDWTITSGGAAKQIQKLLNSKYNANVTVDGGMGGETVAALNGIKNQDLLLQDIAEIRRQYYTNLTINDPTQIDNLKGWLNRVNDCLQTRE
ncbi:glycoside hydrolase family 108 protein [Burkholderia territorii]|uniref:glycoside hydrolase family 108 protein n=1 Tax=Burkholderia territorii TaxID=1503055 RepID=UPI000A92D6E5|nr:glycosyl hydrolase 108 family protein [Burkholderia territorii]